MKRSQNKSVDSAGSTKRKRTVLTILQKLELLKKLKHGLSVAQVSQEYGLSMSTIYDIRAQKDKLLKFYANTECNLAITGRKTLRGSKSSAVDCLVFNWFRQKRNEGIVVTGPMLIEKAKQYHIDTNSEEKCEYSSGWLQKFKDRHGIRHKNLSTQKLSGNKTKHDPINNMVTNDQPSTSYNLESTSCKSIVGDFSSSTPGTHTRSRLNTTSLQMGHSPLMKQDRQARHVINIESDDGKGNVSALAEVRPSKINENLVEVNLEEEDYVIEVKERSNGNDEDVADTVVELEEGGCVHPIKVEPMPTSSRNPLRLPKLQPRPSGVSQDRSFQQSSTYCPSPPHDSRPSSQYSYPSHTPALSEEYSMPNQPTIEDPHISVFISETRMNNAELRIAMGRITDKVDNILNKLDRCPHHQSRQRWQKSRAQFEEDSDEWKENEGRLEKDISIKKSKLMARMTAVEEKCEILEKENNYLKKDLRVTTSKLISSQNKQPKEISDAVKSAMNSVYSDLETRFSNRVAYEGLVIRKTIAACIREVTEQFLDPDAEDKIESDSCKEVPINPRKTTKVKLKKKPSGVKTLSPKVASPKIDVITTSYVTSIDAELVAENPDGEHRESLKNNQIDILELPVITQDCDEFIVKEEICSIASSREGSEVMEVTEQFLEIDTEEKIESDSCKEEEVPIILKETSKLKLKDKSVGVKNFPQKIASPKIDLIAISSATYEDVEMNAENPDGEHGESLKHIDLYQVDILKSPVMPQECEEFVVKEENCSVASSREGSEERVVNMEPSSPPILDAGELSESGEEWLPE